MVDLTLFLLTWNVKDSNPDNGDYGDLLNYAFNPVNGTREPDVIVIGLQEVAFKLVGTDPWVTRTKEILSDRDYVMIKKNQLVGILLMVLVKRSAIMDFANIKTDYTRTGLGGLWGNKGAVSVRFDHKGVSTVLTNSHLAAHDYNLETRISEYKKISGGQLFDIKEPESRSMRIKDHDLSLWMGDLNFRLDELTGQEILQKIVYADLAKEIEERRNQLDDLLKHDQLSKSRRQEKAFNGYSEAPINFSPTYKFIVWSNEYDLGRKPAWCDRILYKVKGSSAIKVSVQEYRSHPEFSQSDHKPVTSFYSVTNAPLKLKAKREIRSSPKLRFIPPSDWRVHHDASAFFTFDEPGIEALRYTYPSRDPTPDRESNSNRSTRRQRSNSADLSSKLSEFDWIGLYPENFTDLEEPISFVWANPEPVSSSDTDRIERLSTSSSSSFDNLTSSSASNSSTTNSPIFKVDFSELVLLKPGRFRLLYFNEDGQLRAMSEPFPIQ